MKTYQVGLQNDVVTSYDKTKTTLMGRVAQKTLPAPYNSGTVLGAPLTKFIDTQTDTTPVAPVLCGMMSFSSNNRLFVLGSAPATGVINNILCYNFNPVTGAHSYVGKIIFAISAPATITTRSFKVDDSNTSNIKIFFGYTSTTSSMGGVLMINKVTLASFTPTGTTYYAAQANDAAAVYALEAPLEVGGANLMTAVACVTVPGTNSSNPAINTKAYVHNGVSATHQHYIFDYAAAPQIASLGTSTVTAANTTGASTTFTMVGNTLAVNDAVIITSNAPTAYTNSTVNSAQTVYYVVASNFVAGSTFSLSATLGGAILAATGTSTTTTFARANGQCTNLFVAKTANLPALAGTLLLTNSENYTLPGAGPRSGDECVFFSTTTNFYLAKLSELYSNQTGTLTSGSNSVTGLSSTSGLSIGQTVFGTGIPAAATIASIAGPTSITLSANATASGAQSLNFGAILWPSIATVNVLGSGIDYYLPVPLQASYDSSIDKVIYPVTGVVSLVKEFVNSAIHCNFGNTGTSYMEAQSHVTDPLQLIAFTGFESSQGWVFFSSSANAGQRGIIAMDLRSDWHFNYSYITSPVIHTPGSPILHSVQTIEKIFDYTGGGVFEYKTAATFSDSIFNDPATGWTTVSTAEELNITLSEYTQFKILSAMSADPGSANVQVTTPLQIVDLEYSASLLAEISDYWDYSYNDSTSAIPTRVGFALRTTYGSGTVPKLHFKAYDTSGVQIVSADTVTNAGNFQYSTDDGASWLPLGTIPNVAGTRLRYTFTTPPGVDVRVGLTE